MRHVFASLFAALIATQAYGCTTQTVTAPAPVGQPAATEEPAAAAEEPGPAEQAEKFGAPLNPDAPVIALAEVLANAESFKDKTITTTGNVRQVCQKSGCWAELRPTATSTGATMRVTFKGYAFFLPKDSKGSDVKIEGLVSVEHLKAEEVAHLEAEGATFPDKKADGSALAIEFIAAGVEMTGRKK